MNTKLTQKQNDTLKVLRPELHAAFIEDCLKANAAAEAKRAADWSVMQAKARVARQQPFRITVSPKGCAVIYGTGSRFPVSLFRGQIEALIANLEELKAVAAKLPERKVVAETPAVAAATVVPEPK